MRFLTAGESHGPGLTVIIDGFPAGVTVQLKDINADLARRQIGYGRGGRMKIEQDTVTVLSGIRFEKTTGAPITLFIENKDWANWKEVLSAEGKWTQAAEEKKFSRPRPGHADLAAYYKYGFDDLRDALERASARETAARVAAGAVAKQLLTALDMDIMSHVIDLGGIKLPEADLQQSFTTLKTKAASNDLRCVGDDALLDQMRQHIDATRKAGSTLGGTIEVIADNVIPGLGSYTQWDRRLDGLLAQAIMSIQAVKVVSLGAGEQAAETLGHQFHDEIILRQGSAKSKTPKTLTRPTNQAGGLEAGVTNGQPIVLRAVMKPISTLIQPLQSVNLATQKAEAAHFERSDVTAVAACGVVCEAMTAFVIAQAIVDKFGRDTLQDIKSGHQAYLSRHPLPSASP